jgi:flagellin-like protein
MIRASTSSRSEVAGTSILVAMVISISGVSACEDE